MKMVPRDTQQSCSPSSALIPERVMVCMSSNAGGGTSDPNGARIAGRLGARWYAVYVETPREAPGQISAHDRDALCRNIKPPKRSAQTVVRVKADRPADGSIAFAKREGITQVVLGQTARSRWEIPWKGSTLNRFLEECATRPFRSFPSETSSRQLDTQGRQVVL